MQIFETSLSLITLLFMVALATYSRLNHYVVYIFISGCLIFAFHLFFERPRWQMLTTYILFIILGILFITQFQFPPLLKWTGFTIGFMVIATSLFLTSLFPMVELPVPTGVYKVGTSSYTLVDESRQEAYTNSANVHRELFIEVWYPASKSTPKNELPPVKTLWNELYHGKLDRISFFMRYLKGVDTHSYLNLPIDLTNGPYPLIIYNHGLQMFTAQNTLLMEHLASHGYVVVSIAHPYESLRVNLPKAGTVIPPFLASRQNFQEAMRWVAEASQPINQTRATIEQIDNREERAEIMLNAIAQSNVNDIVALWADDTRLVLDHLLASPDSELFFSKAIDSRRIGIMGMSVGGATATEVCKTDRRCVVGINVDGLQYGHTNSLPLTVPFLMMTSEDGAGLNEFLMLQSKNDYFEFHIKSSRHGNFTDFNYVWPFMKMTGQLGTIPKERMNDILNNVVLNFFNHYLKDEPFSDFTSEEYPEVTVEIKQKETA